MVKHVFEFEQLQLDNTNGFRYVLSRSKAALSYSSFIQELQSSSEFRRQFISLLNDAPFEAYFWETPPITLATRKQDFEFVLIEASSLTRMQPDTSAFAEYFEELEEGRPAVFQNLGGDAVLIAPGRGSEAQNYTHLASFIRGAPESEVHALLIELGRQAEKRISQKPVWISTSGLGVSWLHVRLDDYPKYYQYAPYKRAA